SVAQNAYRYDLQQRKSGGAWSTIASLFRENAWSFMVITEPLDDLADYEWQVIPYDAQGVGGDPVLLASEKIVRTPPAPDYTVSYDSGTSQVTFAAAS
ncbi:MAG: hypothetical protein D6788_11380, partial [Planctomycetota bacterium]